MSTDVIRPLRPTVALDVSDRFDNVGFSSADATDRGALNIWSNSLPLEQVPWDRPGHVVLGGVEFRLAASATGQPDNFRCAGQLLPVPPGEYDWIHVLATAERRTEDVVQLHFDGGLVDPEWIRVSDFWPETAPWFGERDGMRFTVLHYPRHVQPAMGPAVWAARVPVPRRALLRAVRWPDNPAIHVFAVSLERAGDFG